MRISILTFGTRGEIQPAVALGVGLNKAGHAARVVTSSDFRALVTEHGLDFWPFRLDLSAMMNTFGQADWSNSGVLALRFVPMLLRTFGQAVEQITRDFWEASQGADIAIGAAATDWIAGAVAEKLGIPFVDTCVLPFAPTRAFPAVLWPGASFSGSAGGLRGELNLITYGLLGRLTWLGLRPLVNRCRRGVLGLPGLSFSRDRGWIQEKAVITLAGFSQLVLPRPAEWDAKIHITGSWFLDAPSGYTPPDDLRAFLEAGAPPVYIGFGSMPSKDPLETTALVRRALRLAGRRGVLLTGKSILGQGMARGEPSGDLFFLESAPHAWLFPRMAAVAHHGGSGTTAAGLRAGVPSILVPFAADQLLWAARVDALGVGPNSIRRARLTAERLAEAITQATGDRRMQERAAALGEKIRAEDGTGEAARLIADLTGFQNL